MRHGLVVMLLALTALLPRTVAAQTAEQPAQRGDGGLHVSGGGVVGYVGGSGSISGNVRGPGGSSGTRSDEPRPAPQAEPNVLTDGVVGPAELEVEPASARTSEGGSNRVALAALFAMVAIGFTLLARGRRLNARTAR